MNGNAPNPFYVHPGGDMTRGLAGIANTVGKIQEQRKEESKEQKALDKFNAIKAEAQEVLKTRDPDLINAFVLRNPEFSQAVKMSAMASGQDAARQSQIYDSAYKYIDAKDETGREQVMDNLTSLMNEDGVSPKQRSDIESFLQKHYEEPDKALTDAKLLLVTGDNERWNKYAEFKGIGGKEEEKPSSSQKEYKMAKDEGFTGSFIEFKQAVSGSGPKTDLEMTKLKAQIADIYDRRTEREDKIKTGKQLAYKKARNLVSGIDSILDEVGKAKTEAKGVLATGISGALTGVLPQTPAYNLKRRVETLKANLGFDKLQSMRDASPTGGALGQVSERELTLLTSALTSLDPNMGDTRLIAALDKVEKHYNNWRQTLLGEMPARDEDLPEGVSEEDIQVTMEENDMTRQQVLDRLRGM